jgi:DNA (cytosine-5)-methyltransferase 1
MPNSRYGYYELFSGGGMARLGLGDQWQCLMANDICPKKVSAYQARFGSDPKPIQADIADLNTLHFPGEAVLSWASFPCQDLSLAGNGLGLKGNRSSTFWPFWERMIELDQEGRATPVVVLENVVGALTSRNGTDFKAIFKAITEQGYNLGAMVMNAKSFLPQSRPRLFLVAVKDYAAIPPHLFVQKPNPLWHPKQVVRAFEGLSPIQRDRWIWWSLPEPPPVEHSLLNIIEDDPQGVRWHTVKETRRILSMMSEINLAKVKHVQASNKRTVGTVYKRTRKDVNGNRAQRAEVRFDQISGCLRTPVGGSSRQIIMLVKGVEVKTRLLSPREAARLMGVDDNYPLPSNYNDAYHLMGDGLAVPVVSWLSEHLLLPLASQLKTAKAA